MTASGTNLKYQWRYKGTSSSSWTEISGATSTSYTVTASSSNSGYAYDCRVSNSAGTAYTNTVYLTTTYAFVYYANRGTGAPSSQTKTHGVSLTLSSVVPTRSGYEFVGWWWASSPYSSGYYDSNSGSYDYSPGQAVTANANRYLYAVWRKAITITYNANGGSGAPSAQMAYAYNSATSSTFTISSAKPTRSGYTFLGWATSSASTSANSSYDPGDSVTLSSSVTLYAVWRANDYTVTFEGNGGSVSKSSKSVTYGSPYGTLPTAKRGGYYFSGWFTAKSGGTEVTGDMAVATASDHALYAHWTKSPSVKDARVTLSPASYTYDGKAKKPSVTVIYGGAKLTASRDYTVTYAKGCTNAGTYKVTVKGKGDYAGTKTATFTIARASVAKASVSSIGKKTYSGSAIEPKPTVKVGGRTLKAGTDYTLSYKDNKKAGTATVTIKGKGNYAGTKTATFTIARASVAKASASSIPEKTYSGSAIEPKPKVRLGGRTLKRGTDYTLSYKNNKKAGTARVVIKGKGNYGGTKTVKFKIARRSVAKAKVYGLTYVETSRVVIVNGKEDYKSDGPVKVDPMVEVGSRTLKRGTDYTLSYSKKTLPGTYTLVIKGKGNYKGTRRVRYTIKPSVRFATARYRNRKPTASNAEPDEFVYKKGTKYQKKLKYGTDYMIDMLHGQAIFMGMGKYAGEKGVPLA